VTPDAHVHIEWIVLHGMPITRGREADLGAAVAAELGRLFREEGIPPGLASTGQVGRLRAPAVRVTDGGAGTLGVDVARSVYRGLGAGPGSAG